MSRLPLELLTRRPALPEQVEVLQVQVQGLAAGTPMAAVRLVRRLQRTWLLQPMRLGPAPLSKWQLRPQAWNERLAQRSQIGRCHSTRPAPAGLAEPPEGGKQSMTLVAESAPPHREPWQQRGAVMRQPRELVGVAESHPTAR